MTRNFYFILLALLLITPALYSQGCSDAGVCSINNFSMNKESEADKVAFRPAISQTFELGEENIPYAHTQVQFMFQNRHWSYGLLVPHRFSYYKSEMYSGLTDVTVSGSYSVKSRWNIGAAFKLPVNDANSTNNNGLVLPMALQTSLGTYDIISSLQYKQDKWQLSIGYQHPLTQNKNSFVSTDDFSGFVTTNDFERGDDVMARGDYFLKKGAKTWQFSMISVYRIGGDKSEEKKIEGSEGLSLNLYVAREWKSEQKSSGKIFAAVPIKVREVRPDGLTRSFIIGATWSGLFTR